MGLFDGIGKAVSTAWNTSLPGMATNALTGKDPFKEAGNSLSGLFGGGGSGPSSDESWNKGMALGTQLTGKSASEIGQGNQALNERINQMVDQPSIGANRLQEAGNAQLAQLIANQSQQGVTGGLAQAQRMQLQRNTARDVATKTQQDYQTAVDRLTAKQKSDAGTFVNLTSARAAQDQANVERSQDGLLGLGFLGL